LPRNQNEHSKNSTRENHDVYCLCNAKSILSKLLAATNNGSPARPNPSSAAFTAVLASVLGNPNQSATTTNSRNIATTSELSCPSLETLSGSKLFYLKLEKIAYAVVMAARKLGIISKGIE
jgi:hypothetical protein